MDDDQNGLNLATGWGFSNEINWNNGVVIYGAGAGQLFMYAPDEIVLSVPGTGVGFSGGSMHTNINIGTPVARVGNIYSQGVYDTVSNPWNDRWPVGIDNTEQLHRLTGWQGSVQVQTPDGWRSLFIDNGLVRAIGI